MVYTHLYHQECCHRGLGYVFECPHGDPHNYFGGTLTMGVLFWKRRIGPLRLPKYSLHLRLLAALLTRVPLLLPQIAIQCVGIYHTLEPQLVMLQAYRPTVPQHPLEPYMALV